MEVIGQIGFTAYCACIGKAYEQAFSTLFHCIQMFKCDYSKSVPACTLTFRTHFSGNGHETVKHQTSHWALAGMEMTYLPQCTDTDFN